MYLQLCDVTSPPSLISACYSGTCLLNHTENTLQNMNKGSDYVYTGTCMCMTSDQKVAG